jgi:AcrR family transcriptional regulator
MKTIPESRERLLDAASEVFSEQGFEGARVEKIAVRAAVNKAMIYYHFRGKRGLYQAVLLRHFGPMRDSLRAISAGASAHERLARFYGTLARHMLQHPALPRMMIREVLAGGQHMEDETARTFLGILSFVREALEEGARGGAFRAVDPVLFHFATIGPVLLHSISEALRARLDAVAEDRALPRPDPSALLTSVQESVDRLLIPATSERSVGP